MLRAIPELVPTILGVIVLLGLLVNFEASADRSNSTWSAYNTPTRLANSLTQGPPPAIVSVGSGPSRGRLQPNSTPPRGNADVADGPSIARTSPAFTPSRGREVRTPPEGCLTGRPDAAGCAPGADRRTSIGRSVLYPSEMLGTRVRPAATQRLPLPPQSRNLTPQPKGFFDAEDDDEDDDDGETDLKKEKKTFKIKKHKLKKWLLPLVIAYKLKFLTVVPLLFAALALLVASAGFAGFFFAMFTAAISLHKGGH